MSNWEEFINYPRNPINSFYDLPLDIQEQVKAFVEKNGIKRIKVFGSYFTGTQHTQDSPQEWLEIKSRVKTLKKQSDLDCIVEDFQNTRIGDLDIFNTDRFEKHKGLLIYNNKEYI